jgi:hypothetical protein
MDATIRRIVRLLDELNGYGMWNDANDDMSEAALVQSRMKCETALKLLAEEIRQGGLWTREIESGPSGVERSYPPADVLIGNAQAAARIVAQVTVTNDTCLGRSKAGDS